MTAQELINQYNERIIKRTELKRNNAGYNRNLVERYVFTIENINNEKKYFVTHYFAGSVGTKETTKEEGNELYKLLLKKNFKVKNI